jgi:hypothetical protein
MPNHPLFHLQPFDRHVRNAQNNMLENDGNDGKSKWTIERHVGK